MLAAIRSELRKLLSVRSTYVILFISFALSVLFAFYVVGWHTDPTAFDRPGFLALQFMSAVATLGLLVGIVTILLVTHEYRYNTIVYTLTANKSRVRVLLAKFLVISAFSIAYAFVFGLISVLLSLAAIHLKGFELAPQQFDPGSLIWSTFVTAWGFAAYAFIIASIIRVQVGAIAMMFLLPATVEQLLGALLKNNQIYLPYTALSNVFVYPDVENPLVTSSKAAFVVLAYIAVGGAVSLILFVRRDAN